MLYEKREEFVKAIRNLRERIIYYTTLSWVMLCYSSQAKLFPATALWSYWTVRWANRIRSKSFCITGVSYSGKATREINSPPGDVDNTSGSRRNVKLLGFACHMDYYIYITYNLSSAKKVQRSMMGTSLVLLHLRFPHRSS